MKNFLEKHYDHYYIQTQDGLSLETTRSECLLPGEIPTVDNPYKQRWLYDIEAGYIIRLTRDEKSEKLHRANSSGVRNEERYHARKYACIGKGKSGCNADCENCQTGRIARTVELDKPISNDGEVKYFEITAPDIFAKIEEIEANREDVRNLRSAILQLPKEHQTVVILHFFKKKTHAEIAQILGKERSSVTRQLQTAIKNLKKLLG